MAERLAAKKDKAAHQQVLVRFARRSNAFMRPRVLVSYPKQTFKIAPWLGVGRQILHWQTCVLVGRRLPSKLLNGSERCIPQTRPQKAQWLLFATFLCATISFVSTI